MKIKSISLQNFKCHKDLAFEIKKKSCLIYGENGSGKSSIYWALYSVFKTHFRNPAFDCEGFKKRDAGKNFGITVTLDDNSQLKIPEKDASIQLEKAKTIYFANQNTLDDITCSSVEQFYQVVWLKFKKYFSFIQRFDDSYQKINASLTIANHGDKVIEKREVDQKYKNYLQNITSKTNHILMDLQEDFSISFDFKVGLLNERTQKEFHNPTLSLKINNEQNLQLHFNEAKLKMTALSIFFALIKIEENKNNQLKLLVLDDFLTSLDMANRKYIIEYIFTTFKKYQIIIFTHNLQFNNLILDWLKVHNQLDNWDVKNIYLRMNNGHEESVIYDKESNYLKQAEKYLDKNELPACGNFIRKEFERIIHELEKKYQLGDKEACNNIVDRIKGNQPIYEDPNALLQKVQNDIQHCQNLSNSVSKASELKNTLDEISIKDISNRGHLKAILKNLMFYRRILMNTSSHDNPDTEIYRKEYKNSLRIVKQLHGLLS